LDYAVLPPPARPAIQPADARSGSPGAVRGVPDIAYDVGFGDLSYFNRSFRRRFGRTPSEVRREGG